jgi:hypothetical protein
MPDAARTRSAPRTAGDSLRLTVLGQLDGTKGEHGVAPVPDVAGSFVIFVVGC